jgi:hypothetical protein
MGLSFPTREIAFGSPVGGHGFRIMGKRLVLWDAVFAQGYLKLMVRLLPC